MKTLLSPAKTLNFDSDLKIGDGIEPFFPESSAKIGNKLSKLSVPKLMQLQGISKDLAQLNRKRNQDWSVEQSMSGRQAALAFKGDVYLGMEAENWSEPDMAFANDNIWILSGLYGVVQPNTMILPYRLEMGTPLPVGRKRNLYEFWKADLSALCKEHLQSDEPIVNLASKEYAQAIKQLDLPNPIIDCEFLDESKGEHKVLSFFAKKARGIMANYIVQNRIIDWQELKDFNLAGYYFDPDRSEDRKFVFLRDKK